MIAEIPAKKRNWCPCHNYNIQLQSTLDDDDLTEEGNGSISDSGPGSADESGNVDMEDTVNISGCDSTLEAAANKGTRMI